MDQAIDLAYAGKELALFARARNWKRYWSAAIHRLIDALPEELRQPLALSAAEDLTSQEIGEIMGIPNGTVRSRLSRARQLLKQKLGALMAGTHGH